MAATDSLRRGDLVLDVTDGGPPGGDVVVLLHGFPQDATCWAGVRPALHEAGLRTLAPDQRGYSPRGRPRGVSSYRSTELVGDVVALLDAAGVDRAHIVGHDWGGAVAWALASSHPDRVASLVAVSTPHPAALRWALRHGDQARRSWYVLAFALPVLPERAFARILRGDGLVRSGVPGEHARRYAERLGRAEALRGPLNWYRALFSGGRASVPGPVQVPTTYLWGNRDPFLGRAAAERTQEHVRGDYRFREVDAGHWLPEREPLVVARAVLERTAGGAPSP